MTLAAPEIHVSPIEYRLLITLMRYLLTEQGVGYRMGGE